jgi:hypothetical protein
MITEMNGLRLILITEMNGYVKIVIIIFPIGDAKV